MRASVSTSDPPDFRPLAVPIGNARQIVAPIAPLVDPARVGDLQIGHAIAIAAQAYRAGCAIAGALRVNPAHRDVAPGQPAHQRRLARAGLMAVVALSPAAASAALARRATPVTVSLAGGFEKPVPVMLIVVPVSLVIAISNVQPIIAAAVLMATGSAWP
jgi:hypothetical protein